METFSVLLFICEGYHWSPVDPPYKGLAHGKCLQCHRIDGTKLTCTVLRIAGRPGAGPLRQSSLTCRERASLRNQKLAVEGLGRMRRAGVIHVRHSWLKKERKGFCKTKLCDVTWAPYDVSHRRQPDYLLKSLSRLTAKNMANFALLFFVRGVHRWPVDSPTKGQWCGNRFHVMTSPWNSEHMTRFERSHCFEYRMYTGLMLWQQHYHSSWKVKISTTWGTTIVCWH